MSRRRLVIRAIPWMVFVAAAIPAMIDSGGGAIVFTASADAYNAASTRVSYQMSKAAELALMRHIARRYGPKGIRANAICPGATDTPALREVRPGHHVACHHAETLELKGIHDLPKAGALST